MGWPLNQGLEVAGAEQTASPPKKAPSGVCVCVRARVCIRINISISSINLTFVNCQLPCFHLLELVQMSS